MSDYNGFDFNNDGKVSWEESHLTYHIERETARNNSLYDALHKSTPVRKASVASSSSPSDISKPIKTTENTSVNKRSYTGLIVFIVIIVGILACIIGDNIIKRVNDDKAYAHAIELIQNGEYSAAKSQLWDLEGKGFGDVKALEKYCNALSEYERGSYISAKIDLEACIDAVRKHNEFADSEELLNTIIPLADAEREENKRQAEERERIAAENWKKNGVPYVGMRESEINTSSLGKYGETAHNYEGSKRANLYYWYNSQNKCIFVVRCLDGKVVKATDYRNNPWNYHPGKVTFTYSAPDVSDYYSPEDFYDDYYDDFFDYEEAEDYYYDHGGF